MRFARVSILWVVTEECALTRRFAVCSDAEAIAALHAASWRRHYRGAYADAYLDGDVTSERLAVWSSRLCSSVAQTATVLAETPDGLAGFAHVILDADERWGALLDNLHVAAAYQRRGIGSLLMADAARAVGCDAMYLWVLEQNAPARDFYRALGGETVERAVVEPPGGVAGRLAGTPVKLRVVWPDASVVSRSRGRAL